MSEILIAVYIIMGIILYFRLRAMTNYSSLHCFFIALTSSIPVIIRNICLGVEWASRWLVELGFILGGTDSEEMNKRMQEKMGKSLQGGDQGDE